MPSSRRPKVEHGRSALAATWQPAAFVTHDVALLTVLLGCAALVRAEDYAHGAADNFGVLEAAMPLWLWSLGCFTIGSLILAGITWRRHFAVWLGHALGTGLYAMVAVAVTAAAFDRWPQDAEASASVPTPVWGLMCAALAVVVAVGVAAIRGGPNCNVGRATGIAGLVVLAAVVALPLLPIDGLRGVAPLVVMGVLHGICAIRSGPRPLGEDSGARVVEATVAPSRE